MKIVRFISEDQKAYTGVIENFESNNALIIEGDIFDDFSIKDEQKRVVTYLPPLLPANIFCLGLNYARHIAETGAKLPSQPVIFLKSTNTVCAHQQPIIIPEACAENEVDYEAELAIVIGKTGKNISVEQAMDFVFGYCCANDVSARNWQINLQAKQWARGKSFDTFCPLGPAIITKDEIPEPNNLQIKCYLNRDLMQNSSTADMIFKVPEIVSNLSQGITLYAGTVILTGTPEGVGFTRKPLVCLKDGDIVEVEIEGLSRLINPVRAENFLISGNSNSG